jgi:hypothetical protein
MKDVYNIEDLKIYNKFDKIIATMCHGSIKEIPLCRCKSDFTISKFYKKDIVNLWGENAEDEIKNDDYFDEGMKQVLIEVLNGQKKYCWSIDYIANGFNLQSYNETIYISSDEIKNQDDLDRWGREILDWVYHDCQGWHFEKDNQ